MTLKTDFKDDIFEGNRKYQILDNGDGSISLVDVTEYTQTGDSFGAGELNAITTEVNETKKSVSDGKGLIAAAITAKKIAAAATDTFAQLADKIGQIICGSGTATAPDVRQGKTFTNDEGVETEGTMPEKAAATYTPGTSNQTIAAGQYLAGAQTIKGDANLKGANILQGKSIFGVVGTLAVQSAINFSAAAIAYDTVRISWTNPSQGPWQGVQIKMSTSSYPGVSGGTETLVYTGTGNNTTAGGSNYVDITGLSENTTYFFTCYSYVANLGNGTGYNVTATTPYNPGVLYDYGDNRCIASNDDDVVFYSGYIYHGTGNDAIYTTKTFDLSQYSYLNFIIEPYFKNTLYGHEYLEVSLFTCTSAGKAYDSTLLKTATFFKGSLANTMFEINMDISELTANNYLYFRIKFNDYGSTSYELDTYKIWLS